MNHDNADTFVDRLERENLVERDGVVKAVLQDDQSHTTRSLKRFFGQTPVQIVRVNRDE
jgi:hypothetical protein